MPGLAALQRLPEPAPPVAAVALPAAAPGSLQWAVLSALLAFVTSTLKSVALTHRLVHVAGSFAALRTPSRNINFDMAVCSFYIMAV